MYEVIYLNTSSERVSYMCETMDEVINLAKAYPISLVLDEANNIITGEVMREINQINEKT